MSKLAEHIHSMAAVTQQVSASAQEIDSSVAGITLESATASSHSKDVAAAAEEQLARVYGGNYGVRPIVSQAGGRFARHNIEIQSSDIGSGGALKRKTENEKKVVTPPKKHSSSRIFK